jgi:hypothetical protein
MKYNPKDAKSCLDAAEYPATLYKADEKISKEGNQMLLLQWQIELRDGRTLYIKDYVVNPSSLWKLRNLASAWGCLMEFEAGTFDPSEHLKRAATLLLIVEHSDQYGDQNRIKSYKPSGAVNGETRVPEPEDDLSKIPF